MDPTLDAYANLARRVLDRAIEEAQSPTVCEHTRLEARLFLMSDDAQWLAESLGLDIGALRERALERWIEEP